MKSGVITRLHLLLDCVAMNRTVKNHIRLASLAIVLLAFAACRKYEDGPGLSFRSKINRITGQWERYTLLIDGELPLAPYILSMELDKDGNYSALNTNNGGDTVSANVGTWRFVNDKEAVELNTQSITNVDTSFNLVAWDIKKLKNDDLWVDYVLDGVNYHMKFRKKE